MIPDDVQQALGLAAAHGVNAALTPRVDQAVERASAPTVDGGTLELWTARRTVGGTGAYLRHLDAAGASPTPGRSAASVSLGGGGKMGERRWASAGARMRPGTSMTIGGPLGDGH